MNFDEWHEQAGRAAYIAWNKTCIYKTVLFDDLNELDQQAWRDAARAVLAEGKIEVRPSAELAEAATREENERLIKIARDRTEDAQSYRDAADELSRKLNEITRARNYLASSVERLIDSGERMTQKWEMADAEITALKAERDMYRDLAEQLYQDDACSFDHHGGCQTHGWLELEPGEECPDGRAQRLFAKKDKTDDDVRACTGCGTCAICAALPRGLCGDRFDHAPHLHESAGLGRFWCEADQSKRLPYAMERKTQQHETHEIIACTGCASGCEGCN